MIEIAIALICFMFGLLTLFSQSFAQKTQRSLQDLIQGKQERTLSTNFRILTGMGMILVGIMFLVSAITR